MIALILFLAALQASTAWAQPAPTFRATCGELRQALRDHRIDGEELVTIEVVGTLTIVRSDGALVYMGVCRPPDPEVLCVTYETGGRKAGERAVVTGAYIPRGPDYIQLDPCLHHDPE
jgi:hypothetical protein